MIGIVMLVLESSDLAVNFYDQGLQYIWENAG